MKYQTLNILLLPFLLAAMLAGIYLMPRKGEVFDSSISMELPTGLNPDGWHGTRRQESEGGAQYPCRGYGVFQGGLPPAAAHQRRGSGKGSGPVPGFHRQVRA